MYSIGREDGKYKYPTSIHLDRLESTLNRYQNDTSQENLIKAFKEHSARWRNFITYLDYNFISHRDRCNKILRLNATSSEDLKVYLTKNVFKGAEGKEYIDYGGNIHIELSYFEEVKKEFRNKRICKSIKKKQIVIVKELQVTEEEEYYRNDEWMMANNARKKLKIK